MQNPRALKKKVMEIYAKYVGNQVKVTDINVPLKEESFHQRDILERKVFCLLQQELGWEMSYGLTKFLTP